MNLFTASQRANLNLAYSRAVNDSLNGTWLIDHSVSVAKLEPVSLFALLDVHYAPVGLSGTHSFALRDFDDNQYYKWTFKGSTLYSKELMS